MTVRAGGGLFEADKWQKLKKRGNKLADHFNQQSWVNEISSLPSSVKEGKPVNDNYYFQYV